MLAGGTSGRQVQPEGCRRERCASLRDVVGGRHEPVHVHRRRRRFGSSAGQRDHVDGRSWWRLSPHGARPFRIRHIHRPSRAGAVAERLCRPHRSHPLAAPRHLRGRCGLRRADGCHRGTAHRLGRRHPAHGVPDAGVRQPHVGRHRLQRCTRCALGARPSEVAHARSHRRTARWHHRRSRCPPRRVARGCGGQPEHRFRHVGCGFGRHSFVECRPGDGHHCRARHARACEASRPRSRVVVGTECVAGVMVPHGRERRWW